MRAVLVGLSILFVASFASAAEPTQYQKCEQWRATQKPVTTKGKDGKAAAQKCTKENAGAVFYVNPKTEEAGKDQKGSVYVEVTVNRCERSLADSKQCSVVWRNAKGNVETLTIPMDGDFGKVMEQNEGWKGKEGETYTFADAVKQVEQEQVNKLVDAWKDSKNPAQFTPAALNQIAGSFDARAAESMKEIPSTALQGYSDTAKRLEALSGSLTPYAGAAQQAHADMQAARDIREMLKAQTATVQSGDVGTSKTAPVYSQLGYAPASSFPKNEPVQASSASGAGSISSALERHEQNTWTWVEQFEQSPTVFGTPVSNGWIISGPVRGYAVVVGGWSYIFGQLGY